MSPAGKTGFDDAGRPVPVEDFQHAEEEAARADRDSAISYYRDKLQEIFPFFCDALLSGNPTAEQAGRRAYFLALVIRQPPFETQTELATHLGLSKGAISQQLNSFLRENPILAGLWRDSTVEELNLSSLVE